MNITYLVSKYPFLWCQAFSAKEVYSKVMYNTYWAIFAPLLLPFLLELATIMKFSHNLGQKYF